MAERRPLVRRSVAVAICLVLLGSLLSACSFAVPGSAGSSAFVTRSGSSFEVNGKPFRFVGFNLYDAAASDIYSCSPSTRLDDAALARAMRFIRKKAGATVVRFWAYQTYTAGGTDFSGTDRVIKAARKAGLRVMPVLEDGPGDCSTGQPRVSLAQADGGTWFTAGYRRPYGTARVSYRRYAQLVTHHYRNNPTIVGWTMVNEAETTQRDAQGRTALVGFARDMARVIHRADPNHLVTLGSQSNGAPGASGSDFAAVYGLKGLDFTEVHDWDRYGSDTEAMPGSVDGRLPAASSAGCRTTTAQIACSFAISRALRKPLVVGEVGIAAADSAARSRRAGLIRAKMNAAFRAGADGYLVWQLNTENTDGIAVITGSDDPLFPVLRRGARALR